MISVIICAAGSGTRANLAENKILHELNGMPVLCYSLSAFSPLADEILVACREEDKPKILPLLSPFQNARTVCGGATRFESVKNALKEVKGEIVLVHDAARPFVTRKIIEDCIESVKKYGSGVCALPATDTTIFAQNGEIVSVPARETVFTVQTPQGFYTKELLRAYEEACGEFTDDSGVYAKYIAPPHIFIGDRENRKLTFSEDFLPAERVGFGVDTHAFDIPDDYYKGTMRLNLNYVVLGGVTIPSKFTLKAHSDGDVIVHALMDALLSAIGERDIGFHFPDTDPAYKNANSMEMLRVVTEKVRAAGMRVKNVSISVLAEEPRLAPYIEKMRENLCAALGSENVAIAAGTNEKLGYIGEGKGITAYAFVLITKER